MRIQADEYLSREDLERGSILASEIELSLNRVIDDLS